MTVLPRFDGGFGIECEKRRGPNNDSKDFGLSNEKSADDTEMQEPLE